MMQPQTWDRDFYAQRSGRPLVATVISSGGICSIILPPLATESIVQQVVEKAQAWINKNARRPPS